MTHKFKKFLFSILLLSSFQTSQPNYTLDDLIQSLRSVGGNASVHAATSVLTTMIMHYGSVVYKKITSPSEHTILVKKATYTETNEYLKTQALNPDAVHPSIRRAFEQFNRSYTITTPFIIFAVGPGGTGKTEAARQLAVKVPGDDATLDADVTKVSIKQYQQLFKGEINLDALLEPVSAAHRRQQDTGRRQCVIIDEGDIKGESLIGQMKAKIDQMEAPGVLIIITSNYSLPESKGALEGRMQKICEVDKTSDKQRLAYIKKESELHNKKLQASVTSLARTRQMYWENQGLLARCNPMTWYEYYTLQQEKPILVIFDEKTIQENAAHLTQMSDGLNLRDMHNATEHVLAGASSNINRRVSPDGVEKGARPVATYKDLAAEYANRVYINKYTTHMKAMQRELAQEESEKKEHHRVAIHTEEKDDDYARAYPFSTAMQKWKKDANEKMAAAVEKHADAAGVGEFKTPVEEKLKLSYFGTRRKPFQPYLYGKNEEEKPHFIPTGRTSDPLEEMGLNRAQAEYMHTAAAKIQHGLANSEKLRGRINTDGRFRGESPLKEPKKRVQLEAAINAGECTPHGLSKVDFDRIAAIQEARVRE